MTAGCLFCGRRPVEWHHLTGRLAPDGPYLDRALVVPLDTRHHDREHELLRRAGLEFPPEGADLVGHRVARLLDFMGRCAECRVRLVLEPDTPSGNAVAAVHALLYEATTPLASLRREAAS